EESVWRPVEGRIVERLQPRPLPQLHDCGADQMQDEEARVFVSCVPAVRLHALGQRGGSLQCQAFKGAEKRCKLFAMRAGKSGVELLATLVLPMSEHDVALGERLLLRARTPRLGRAATRLDRRRDLLLGEVEEGVHGASFLR